MFLSAMTGNTISRQISLFYHSLQHQVFEYGFFLGWDCMLFTILTSLFSVTNDGFNAKVGHGEIRETCTGSYGIRTRNSGRYMLVEFP